MKNEFDSKGRMLCDKKGCDNTATVNYQSGMVRWDINRLGNYMFSELMSDDSTNEHWCDEHDV